MKIKQEFDNADFLKFIDSHIKDGDKVKFCIRTWEDGDGFLDVCDDDFGIKDCQIDLFKQKDIIKKIRGKTELLETLKKYIDMKAFSSKNAMYKLGFDIYVTYKNNYFVLCPELNKGYFAELSFLNRIVFIVKESWDKEKYNYWDKQSN